MSENYLGIITENYQWELSSENYDKERTMTQYITLQGTLHGTLQGKFEIYRDTGVSKKTKQKKLVVTLFMFVYKCLVKRYFIIDQQIAQNFMHFSELFTTSLPFYASQIISHFLTLRISANHDKGLGFQPIVRSLYSFMFLQCRISFICLTKNYYFAYNQNFC